MTRQEKERMIIENTFLMIPKSKMKELQELGLHFERYEIIEEFLKENINTID